MICRKCRCVSKYYINCPSFCYVIACFYFRPVGSLTLRQMTNQRKSQLKTGSHQDILMESVNFAVSVTGELIEVWSPELFPYRCAALCSQTARRWPCSLHSLQRYFTMAAKISRSRSLNTREQTSVACKYQDVTGDENDFAIVMKAVKVKTLHRPVLQLFGIYFILKGIHKNLFRTVVFTSFRQALRIKRINLYVEIRSVRL